MFPRLALLLLAASALSLAATQLTVGSVSALPGATVTATVQLSGGASQVAGLQFDLAYDTVALRVTPALGASATAASKSLAQSTPAPGISRILVFGLNQTVMADGIVIQLSIAVGSTAAGSYPLTLTNASATDPAGTVIPLTAVSGAVQLSSGTSTKRTQTIQFGAIANKVLGDTPFTVAAAASSGLSVAFVSLSQSVCTVSGSSVTLLNYGICTIAATQPGDSNYEPAAPVTTTFTVLRAQSISFTSPGTVTLSSNPVSLAVTATSGLAVALASVTPAVCTVSGKVLTTVAAGTCNLTASQGGDAVFAPAPPIFVSFSVVNSTGPVVPAGAVVPLYNTVNTVQPGSWISIFGTNLAPEKVTWKGDFPTVLGGVSVKMNGKAAYLWYVGPDQINLQAPDDTATGLVPVVITNAGGSFTTSVTLAPASPSLSLLDATHVAAIIPAADGSYTVAGPRGAFVFETRPVLPGESLVMFGVGFGPTDPSVPAGQVFTSAAATVNPVTVTIGGQPAPVAFAGLVGAGLYQINVIVPNVPAGDQVIQANVSGLSTSRSSLVTVGQP